MRSTLLRLYWNYYMYPLQVTSAMRSVVTSMASACSARDMHLPSLTATMDRFERMTDHLGTRQTCATQALGGVTATSAGAAQVDLLMARIFDRAGLDVRNVMPTALTESSSLRQAITSPPSLEPILSLDEQLAKLRNDYGWTAIIFLTTRRVSSNVLMFIKNLNVLFQKTRFFIRAQYIISYVDLATKKYVKFVYRINIYTSRIVEPNLGYQYHCISWSALFKRWLLKLNLNNIIITII